MRDNNTRRQQSGTTILIWIRNNQIFPRLTTKRARYPDSNFIGPLDLHSGAPSIQVNPTQVPDQLKQPAGCLNLTPPARPPHVMSH